MGQIIRIDADTMPSDQSRFKLEKIPLRSRCFQYLIGVDPDQVEDLGQFVDEGDVQVALTVFNHLSRFRNLDRTCPVSAVFQNRTVERVDFFRSFRRRTGSDLADLAQRMFPVAGVDPFRGIAAEEVGVELQSAEFLQYRDAFFFGAARIYRAFVDDDGARFQRFADGFARAVERRQIRPVVLVHRRRNRHDEDIAPGQFGGIGGDGQAGCGRQFLQGRFKRVVAAFAKHRNPFRFDVKSDRIVFLTELHRQRQSDVAEADDAKFQII